MFKSILLFLAVSFMMACSNKSKNVHEHKPEVNEIAHDKKLHTGLELNDGKRWQLDESTRKNISEIKGLLQGSAKEKDFQKLAGDLQISTDKLVSECRMQGPDHDTLHTWLKQYIENLKDLRSGKENEKAYAALVNDLKLFDEYFE